MKLIYTLLLVSSTLPACKKTASEPTPNQLLALAYKQPTTLSGTGNALTATLTEVLDSRCPSDANCIWQGYVAVSLALTDATTTQTTRLALHFQALPGYASDSTLVSLNQKSYWLRLLTVLPYPSTTNGAQPKTATLRLRPQ